MLRVQVIAGSPIAGRVVRDPFFRAAVCARLVPKPLHVSVGRTAGRGKLSALAADHDNFHIITSPCTLSHDEVFFYTYFEWRCSLE